MSPYRTVRPDHVGLAREPEAAGITVIEPKKFAILRSHNGRQLFSELVEFRRKSAVLVYYHDSVGALRQRNVSTVTAWDATPEMFAVLQAVELESKRRQYATVKQMNEDFGLQARAIIEEAGGRMP